MKPIKPVFWYQGLFLQPQHFQHFDLYFQSLLSPLITYQQPYFWGVCRIQIHEDELRNETFEISQGEFIFQDGTRTAFPSNAVIHSRTLVKEELEAGKPFKVYLGLRKLDHTGENVSVSDQKADLSTVTTRFIARSEPDEVYDLHQGGEAVPVKLMSYVLKVFWESEIEGLKDYYLLPVAELEFDGDNIKLSRNFVPPIVSMSGSETLQQVFQSIREQVTSRCRKLEAYKSPKGLKASEVEPNHIVYMMALRSLNKYVPLMYHLTETPNIHPWSLYALIRQIIGDLSTFTDRIDALGRLMDGTVLLPEYNHENLKYCFDEAQTLISELLSAITIGPESIIHLEREDGYFKAQIPQEVFSPRNVFYLVLRTAENKSRVLEIMQNIAKVSSVEHISTLISRALTGIYLKYRELPPPGLPTQPNSLYFEFDQSHQEWVEIQKSQSVCLYWDQAPKDAKAQVVVLRK